MNIIEINTDNMESPVVSDGLYENRSAIVNLMNARQKPEVTIYIQAYNNLEKTKRCVSSVLTYTEGIDYELWLIDNGSTDETLEYFKSVPYERKTIYHITKNVGAGFPILTLNLSDFGNYLCCVANDLIVTPHWLENMLICMRSDPKIGMVNPVSSNTSNLQDVEIRYINYDDMQAKARSFNKSDPGKWQERLRMITLGTLFRKEVLYAMGWPHNDVGFFHDFADDDMAFRVRRMGYKAILACDTWICHDHDFRSGEGKDPVEYQRSLETGKQNFRDKYFGVDAWDDVNNFYIPYLAYIPQPAKLKSAEVLGIDVRCGTPILDLKNYLRKFGIFDTTLSAFTQDAKYWLDLKTVCEGAVVCDREEFIRDYFHAEYFDYIIADNPINRYHEPAKIIRDMFLLCKKGGYVFCKLTNAYSFREFLNLIGETDVYNPDISYNITMERLCETLKNYGDVVLTLDISEPMSDENRNELLNLLPVELQQDKRTAAAEKMIVGEYVFVVKKK